MVTAYVSIVATSWHTHADRVEHNSGSNGGSTRSADYITPNFRSGSTRDESRVWLTCLGSPFKKQYCCRVKGTQLDASIVNE